MFESFKSRSEVIDQARFAEFLQDPEFNGAVEALEKEMLFIADQGDGETVTHMEQGPKYDEAVQNVQRLLDAREIRVTHAAIAFAVAEKLDPDSSKGFTEVVG